jgi:hypothetical protein
MDHKDTCGVCLKVLDLELVDVLRGTFIDAKLEFSRRLIQGEF